MNKKERESLERLYKRCSEEKVESCYDNAKYPEDCRFVSDPYECTIPQLLKEILNIR